MRVVLLADSYLPYLSGVSQSVHRFAVGLTQCGAQVLVIAPHYPQNQDHEMPYRVLRVPSLRLVGYPNFRGAWPFGRTVAQTIAEFDPDVLHSHSPFQMGLRALQIARKMKKNVVLTHHTLFLDYVHFMPWGLRGLGKFLLRRYLRWFDNQVNLVITPTAKIKEYLRQEKIRQPVIEVLPTGVLRSAEGAEFDIRSKHGLPADAFVLLYVGRLSKEKNIPFLLEAIAPLCEQHAKLYFVIVAGGPMRREYENWVSRHHMSERIVFAGEQPQENLQAYYQQSNLFVCASKTETQGLVLAEAGLLGLPVLALGYQGVLNMVQSGINGFTTLENKLDFQSRVVQLLGDAQLLSKLKTSSQQFALEHFDQLVLSKKLMALYLKVGGHQK
jgi:1,2-diacylglycerol 3-alpha-glucosyltransferase